MSGGNRSGRTDSAWPNFTKIGPSSSSASRKRTPSGLRRRPNASRRPSHASGRNKCVRQTISSSPCFTSTRWIVSIRVSCRSRMSDLTAARAASSRAAARSTSSRRRLDVAVERLRLERRRHRAAFLLQVLGRVHAQRAGGPREPRARAACGFAERVRGNVADPLRQPRLRDPVARASAAARSARRPAGRPRGPRACA